MKQESLVQEVMKDNMAGLMMTTGVIGFLSKFITDQLNNLPGGQKMEMKEVLDVVFENLFEHFDYKINGLTETVSTQRERISSLRTKLKELEEKLERKERRGSKKKKAKKKSKRKKKEEEPKEEEKPEETQEKKNDEPESPFSDGQG